MNRWGLLGLVAGCHPRVELPDVPIVGGSPEARERARAELARFDSWVGPGRLFISKLRFLPLEGEARGYWNEQRGLLEVDDELSPEMVDETVRHELCHALDWAEALSLDSPVFERLKMPWIASLGEEGARREVFAQACEAGAFAATAIVASRCTEDDRDVLEEFEFLADRVWRGYESPEPAAEVGEPVAQFAFDQVVTGFDYTGWFVLPTEDPELLDIQLQAEGGGEVTVQAKLWTGERSISEESVPAHSSVADPPPGLPYGVAEIEFAFGWSSGPAAAVSRFLVTKQPSPAPRLLVSNGQHWKAIRQGCVDEQGLDHGLFTAAQQVWFAWDDGQAISWAPLSVE